MRVNQLIDAIASQYRMPCDKQISIFARGKAGIGKSDAGKGAAEKLAGELNLPFVNLSSGWSAQYADSFCYMQLQATIEDPITLSGLPGTDPEDSHYAVFKAFRDKLPISGRGILEIAEINTAPPAVQAGFYSLFLNRKLGSYQLPEGWYVYATGNLDGMGAATQKMPTPLISRLCILLIEQDLDSWTQWALTHGVRPEVVAFYHYRPELFDTFNAKDPNTGKELPKTDSEPYSCARTATAASWLMDSQMNGLEHEMVAGVVGRGVADELMGFVQIHRNLVHPDAILKDPDKVPVPDGLDVIVATAGALAHKATKENFARVMTYARRMPEEYTVLLVKLAVRRDKKLAETQAFIDWAKTSDSRALSGFSI